MNISDLISKGIWESFYLDKKTGETFPVTKENTALYQGGKETINWSYVCQKKK
jgi:hypothetical protein